MTSIPITTLYMILLALVFLVLAYGVVKQRRSKKIGLGDRGDKDVEVAMRAHANAAEYIPLCVLLLAAFELNGAAKSLVHAFGAALLISRFLHAWGFYKTKGGSSPQRFYGVALNWLVILGLCIANAILIAPSLLNIG